VPKTRPPFPPEFRREAVELMRVTEKPLPELARDLGVSQQTLRNWRRQSQGDQGSRSDGLSTVEREEIRDLRKRLRTAEMEREVLRKAAAFFARESEGR